MADESDNNCEAEQPTPHTDSSVENGKDSLENGNGENPETEENKECYPSHFRNKEAHSCAWRYGVPIYILSTIGLLLAADIGSDVAAEYILLYPDGTVFERKTLFTASIFSSVKELWNTGSYALAILIVITSILWPYVKLLLTLFSWVCPYRSGRRREHLLEVVDALGKWSFVDIFVLLIIMVSFRATIETGLGTTAEIVVVPRWGFYGFVLATMLSLLGTQAILYRHRLFIYDDADGAVCRQDDGDGEEGAQPPDNLGEMPQKQPLVSNTKVRTPIMLFLLASTLALVVVGCVIDIFEVTNTQAGTVESVLYSVLKVGSGVTTASLDPNSVGVRWIQAMYYFLGFALPLWSTILFAILYLVPMTAQWHRRMFMLSEMTFSWSSLEVLMICCVFSVLQIPTFGNGLIESGCEFCYQVGSSIFPEFAVLAVATALQVAVSVWLYRSTHGALYPHSNM